MRPVTCECGKCKTCGKRDYLRKYAAENAEHLRAYQSEYREANKDRLREQRRNYREANAEKVKAQKAAYYQRNKERIAEQRRTRDSAARVAQAKDWAKRNPDKRAAIARRDKCKRRGADLTPLAADYTQVLLGDPCAYCGNPATTVDHIVPIARGGSSDWDNLTAACSSCNSSKHARPLLLFMRERVA